MLDDDALSSSGPFTFEAEVIAWRGPAPYVFAVVPEPFVAPVRAAARSASYGWGVVPVDVTVRGAAFRTSLFPKDGGYLLPLKDAVRAQADVAVGDTIAVKMAVRPRDRTPL